MFLNEKDKEDEMQNEKRVKQNYEHVYKYHNHDYPEWTDKNKEYWVDVFLKFVFLRLAYKHKYEKILEVGCGNGRNLQLLSDEGVKLYGIDISNEGIKKASNRYIGLFTCGSAKKLPFGDNSFDIVYSVHALEQMVGIRKEVIDEIYRVLKPGGIYLCFEPFIQIQNKDGILYNIKADYNTGEIPRLLDETGFIFDKIMSMRYKWKPINTVEYLINRWKWIRSKNRLGLIKAYKEE